MSQPFLVPQLNTLINYETNPPGIDLNYLQIKDEKSLVPLPAGQKRERH